jgi:hypothetical protein
MYGSPHGALHLLEQAAAARRQANDVWRWAIRDAFAKGAPIEQVAIMARTTIDEVRGVLDQAFAEQTGQPAGQ